MDKGNIKSLGFKSRQRGSEITREFHGGSWSFYNWFLKTHHEGWYEKKRRQSVLVFHDTRRNASHLRRRRCGPYNILYEGPLSPVRSGGRKKLGGQFHQIEIWLIPLSMAASWLAQTGFAAFGKGMQLIRWSLSPLKIFKARSARRSLRCSVH